MSQDFERSNQFKNIIIKIFELAKRYQNSEKAEFEEYIKETLKNHIEISNISIEEIEDDYKNTLLHFCMIDSRVDLARCIIDIYENSLNKDKFVEWLVKKNDDDLTALDYSSQKDNKFMIKLVYSYYEKYKINLIYNNGENNILHYICKNNNIFPLLFFYEKLLKFNNKSIINYKNQDGFTPLHFACQHNCNYVIECLLDLNCSISEPNNDKNTPLHLAVNFGDVNTVKSLILYGANKNKKNYQNLTPFDLAVSQNKNDIIKLLEPISLFDKYICFKFQIKKIKKTTSHIELFSYLILVFIIVAALTVLKQIKSQYFRKFDYIFMIITGYQFVFLILLFLFTWKKNLYLESYKNKNISLTELYEEHNIICLKCKREITQSTVHCLACDRCVDNFNHHCFWMNTCVKRESFFKFKLIVFGIFLYQILSLLFFVLYLLILIDDKIHEKFYDIDGNDFRVILYVLISIIFLLILISLYSIIGPVLYTMFNLRKKKALLDRSIPHKEFRISLRMSSDNGTGESDLRF